MGTVTPGTSSAGTWGGSYTLNATYRYVISPVIARQGEILPAVEVSQAVTTGNALTLTFSTPSGSDGGQPISYKVYRTAAGGAAGSETFLGYVDGTVGLAADMVTPILTTGIADTGTALVPYNGSTVPGTLPTAYYGTNTGLYPLAAGLENIYLISRDRNFVIRPYVRECTPLDVYPTTSSPDTLPFALVDDTCLAVRGPKYLGRLARVATSV